jgi:predicted ABC-type transport system involved in lysophospholipase L1 biosynthesis ATPase subunit
MAILIASRIRNARFARCQSRAGSWRTGRRHGAVWQAGKSTLLACLAGLDEPDGGHVEVLGRRLTRQPEIDRARIRAEAVGMLMQSGNLFPTLTVADNVLLPMRLARRIDPVRIAQLLSHACA